MSKEGSNKKKYNFGKRSCIPPLILDCIENGYRLPLKFVPPSYSQHDHQSSQLHCEYVNEAVKSLVLNRCVMKVQSKPEVCSPLSVVGNPEVKLRLVLNLRYLNQFLHVQSFKYENLHIAALMFEQGEYQFKFNLKSVYHHVDIWPEHYNIWDSIGIWMAWRIIMSLKSFPLGCPLPVTYLQN